MISKPYTEAGKKYLDNLTEWLQDTRLMSEAIYRLYREYQKTGRIDFSEASWPKKAVGGLPPSTFAIKPVVLAERMDDLLKNLWSTRFVFLETLWEEYLQDLVQELGHEEAKVFEPFCEREFMAQIVRGVLTDSLTSIEEVKNEVATRFATGITREPWSGQWKQLSHLKIGLTDNDTKEAWFAKLSFYFEMRNCIVHLRGKVSETLKKMDAYFNDKPLIEIWPTHLDFYRTRFRECLFHIEEKIFGKANAKALAAGAAGASRELPVKTTPPLPKSDRAVASTPARSMREQPASPAPEAEGPQESEPDAIPDDAKPRRRVRRGLRRLRSQPRGEERPTGE